MNTVAYLLVLSGLFVMRQVTKGRSITDVPKDLGNLLEGIVEGNTDKMKEVLARTGDTNSVPSSTNDKGIPNAGAGSGGGGFAVSNPLASGDTSSPIGSRVLSAMKSLSASAGAKYVYGAQGPDAYDCSSLVWAACKTVGEYTGPRFTTMTFLSALGAKVTQVGTPTVGDVILWSSHMGVIDGDGTMFSALNPNDGIRSSPISYGPKGESSSYYRFMP